MRILISGAGIGGLTAALCLRQAGHEVQIFEQASQLSEIGAGIQLGANALKVLDSLGLTGELEQRAVAPQGSEFRDFASGEVLYRSRFGEAYRQKYGAPYYHLYRADLQKVLLDALRQTQAVSLLFNARVESCRETDQEVKISLSDGRTFSGDCLVAADGIRSKIRSAVGVFSKPQFTGNMAWRGIVPSERLPSDFMPTVVTNFVGPGRHMVIYYLRNRQLVNFVGVVEDRRPENLPGDAWVTKAPWQALKNDYAGWHPMVQTLIDAVDKQQCYRWALHNHQPLGTWSSRRITLLGDAAHATLPFMAAGAAMAIEDGRILQRSLDRSDSLAEGLRCYQRNRMARTARIQKTSTRLGRLYHLSSTWQRTMAYAGLRLSGDRLQEFVPQYDPNTVELR